MKILKALIRFFLLGVAIAVATLPDPAGGAEPTGELRVQVVGLRSDRGTVRIGLFNSEKSYSERLKSFRGDDLSIKDHRSEWVVENLPYGEYAIMLFHDENNNTKLDTNFFGFPKESYGFSNNPRVVLRQLEFEKAKFKLDTKTKTVVIKVIRGIRLFK